MAVRNKRLYAGQITATGLTTLYVVPASTWTLLKLIAQLNAGGAGAAFNVGVQAGVGGVSVDLVAHPTGAPVAAGSISIFNSTVPMNPADLVYVNLLAAGTVNLWLAGAELT